MLQFEQSGEGILSFALQEEYVYETELSLLKAIVGMRELKNCGSSCQFRMVVIVNI